MWHVDNSAKSNNLPPVKTLAELRDLWPVAWCDVLPDGVAIPREVCSEGSNPGRSMCSG
jgi:hypothetical protein